MEEKQPESKPVTSKQAARGLWDAMVYSEHYKTEYGKILGKLSRFAQFEQVFVCMLTDVPAEQVLGILDAQDIGEGEKIKALQELWVQALAKPQMATEEQEKQIKDLTDCIQGLSTQIAEIQGEILQLRTEFAQRAEICEVTEEVVEPPKKEKKPPLFKTPLNRSGSLQLGMLEKDIAGLTKRVSQLEEELGKAKEEGTQVRGIVLTMPETGTRRQKRRLKKELQNEKGNINQLLAEGHSAGQLDYLLQCREENVPWDIIHLFSGKDIPVELMKKLRNYYMEQYKNVPESGTGKGGETDGE